MSDTTGRELLAKYGPTFGDVIGNLERKLSAANARIAELEKDAARYRWIREHSTQPAEPWSTHSTPESLDDAIDAALRGILG